MSRVVFCGNLPGDIRTREVEDLFYKYGKVIEIDLKTPTRPPAFAFVEFNDPRDAYEAVRGRDGFEFGGGRLRVELAKGGGRRNSRGGGYGGGYGGGISRRSKWRVMVTGLPRTCSWQDLKDFMRRVGDVTYANVYSDRDGMMGIVDFAYREDMDHAIRKLDDTEFERDYFVRVKEDTTGGSPKRSRSRSPRRSPRGRSRSPAGRSLSKSKSRSLSRSPAHSASKSPANNKERSTSRGASPAPSASPARSN